MKNKQYWIGAAILTTAYLVARRFRPAGLFGGITDISATLPRGPGNYTTRQLSRITGITVHHGASSETATPTQYANGHIARGWPGIGYHFVIARDGTTYQTQPLTAISYHNGVSNSTDVGVCMVGNMENYAPTPSQLSSLQNVIGHIKSKCPNLNSLNGHKELKNTACPGKYTDLGAIRSRAKLPRRSVSGLARYENDENPADRLNFSDN